MAGTVLGYMKFVLGFDTIAFRKGMTEAEKDLVKLQKKIEKFGKGMADVGKSMSLGLTAPLAAFAAVGVNEARETAEAMAQVENGIRSMGGVSQKTAADLSKLADNMEMHSLYEADEILRKVTTNLLTFGNITGTTFDKAQQVVVDLATKMQVDLQSAALLVGKALNDPIKGMAGLGRAGIQFDPVQKNLIRNLAETGRLAQAQAIIMKELERQFGGSAQAAQNVDPYNRLQDAFKNIAESAGVILLPILTSIADKAVTLADKFMMLTPTTQNLALGFLAVLAAIGPVLYLVGNFIAVLAGVKVVALFAQGLFGLATAEAAAASGAVAAGAAFHAMLWPIGLLVVALGSVYYAWLKWEQISAIVSGVYKSVSTFLGPELTSILNALLLPIRAVIWGFDALFKLVGKPAAKELPARFTDVMGGMHQLNTEFSKMEQVAPPAFGKTAKAAKATKSEADKLAESAKQLYLKLYPEKASVLQFEADVKALKSLKLSVEETADAIERLRDIDPPELVDFGSAEAKASAVSEAIDPWIPLSEGLGLADPMSEIKKMNDEALKAVAEATKSKTVQMAEAWEEMGVRAVGAMRSMVDSFKSGDILGGIQALLDLVLQLVKVLASVGTFGSAQQAAVIGPQSYGGARAMGGPVVPGKTYMVGENGPEWFSSKRSEFISPNRKEAQPQRVVVVPSPYFDVVVDSRAANVAAPMAGKAAVIGVTGSEARMARRSRRNLLAA